MLRQIDLSAPAAEAEQARSESQVKPLQIDKPLFVRVSPDPFESEHFSEQQKAFLEEALAERMRLERDKAE